MSKFDEIDEFLDVEPVDTPKNNKIEKVEKKEDSALDYEYSRGNLYSLIEKGQEALNGILEVAQGSDHPRACLLYTSDAPDEEDSVDLGRRRIIKKK